MTRLILFLGTNESARRCRYVIAGGMRATEPPETLLPWKVWFEAVGELSSTGALEVVLVGSDQTYDSWVSGGNLKSEMRNVGLARDPRVRLLFLRYDERELAATGGRYFWTFFDQLGVALSGAPLVAVPRDRRGYWEISPATGAVGQTTFDTIVVDITHGFRSVPFVGSAVICHIRSVQRGNKRPVEHRLFYTALEAADGDGVVPVWDLSPFVEATDLSAALDAFRRHGRADDLADFFERRPDAFGEELGPALRSFSDDLLYMRLPNILATTAPGLLGALDGKFAEIVQAYPPLQADLEEFRKDLNDLCPSGQPVPAIDPSGLKATLLLARRLNSTGRNVELACLLGEAFLTAFQVAAVEPGRVGNLKQPDQRGFKDEREDFKAVSSGKKRSAQMVATPLSAVATKARKNSASAAECRNDVAHCSMRDNPKSVAELRVMLDDRLAELEDLASDLEMAMAAVSGDLADSAH